MRSLTLKRILDILISVCALVVAAPLFLLVALLVRCLIGSPVFFRQMRPGLDGKPFCMVKFRTMSDRRDTNGVPLPDGERMTSLGRFLRGSSLDELPELVNVLKGEMSLVGPRPLLMEYKDLYTPAQTRRHEVRPGITGWAQIHGRNSLDWEDRFSLDVWYVDNWTNWMDIKILALTVWKVIGRDGISAEGHATMPPFVGTRGKEQ